MVMFFIIPYFTISAYVEITTKNVNQIIGGDAPVFVKFYSQSCGHCRAMAEDFAEASTYFTDVLFGGICCDDQRKLCEKFKIEGYPTMFLFESKKTEKTAEYEGPRTADAFSDFVENYTHIKGKRPPNFLVEANPLNFENHTKSHKCVFNTFYAPWCGHCKKFLPQAKVVANALQADKEIMISKLNCEMYNEFCSTQKVNGYPTIKLFKGDEVIPFEGKREAENVIDFINKNCGTERGLDGLLVDTAGLIDEAAPLVKEFLESSDKAAVIEKMKGIKGAEFYVKVMDRYVAKGVEQIKKDVQTMNGILTAHKGSFASLDGMKKRFNIFNQFIPKQAEEIKAEL